MLNALTFLFPLGEILYAHITPYIRLRFLDVVVCIFCFEAIIMSKESILYSIKKSGLTLLALSLSISALINIQSATSASIVYLLRTLLYFFFFSCIASIKKRPIEIARYFMASFLIVLLTALIQYLYYPSLRNLMYLGYDPHEFRIFGLFLDPNLIGLFFVWSILYFTHKKQVVLLIISLCILLLTYSRISIIAAIVSGMYLLFTYVRRNRAILITSIAMIVLIIVLATLPKKQGEGTNLLRMNSVISKTHALSITQEVVRKNALFGIGFNTLPSYHIQSTSLNNSTYGLDNSVLTVIVTSGIFGFLGYLTFFLTMFKRSSVVFKAMTLAYAVHSLSTNSFFTPTLFVVYGIFYVLTLSDTAHEQSSQ